MEMKAKVTLSVLIMTGAGLFLLGTNSAANLFRPNPRPGPPGTDQLAIGTFQCTQQDAVGFSFLSIRGTSAVATPFLQGQFTSEAGTATPVTCASLTQQVATDALAGDCSVGPVGDVGGSTTVHFACSGGHDSVVAAIALVTRNFAAATLAGALD